MREFDKVMNNIPTDVIKIITNYVGTNIDFDHKCILYHRPDRSTKVIAEIIINNANGKTYARIIQNFNKQMDYLDIHDIIKCNILFQEIKSVNLFELVLKQKINKHEKIDKIYGLYWKDNSSKIYSCNMTKWMSMVPYYRYNPYKSIIEFNLYDILIKMR